MVAYSRDHGNEGSDEHDLSGWGSDEDLEILRHLPTVNVMPVVEPEIEPLIRGIRHSSDAASARRWLGERHAGTLVRLALQEELLILRSSPRGPALDLEATGPDRVLADLLVRARDSVTTFDAVRAAGLLLLTEALAAPATEDPTQWLIHNRAPLVVDCGLRTAVYRVRLANTSIGERVGSIEPSAVSAADPVTGFGVRLRRVVVGTRGMLLESEAVMSEPAPAEKTVGSVNWHGFSFVGDNCGHRYLVTHFEGEPRNEVGTRRDNIRQTCVPAPPPEATALLVETDGYELVEYDRRQHGDHSRPLLTVQTMPARIHLRAHLAGNGKAG